MVQVDEVGADQRSEREDDGSRIAAGVGDQAGCGDLVGVEFRRAVDGLGLKLDG